MWNLLSIRNNHESCRGLRDALENAGAASLSPAQQKHLSACQDCQAAAADISVSHALFQEAPFPAPEPGPWFAPRVMAAIAARESQLRQSLETWAAVPRLAFRLTWVSALALLLATTWLYQSPRSTARPGNDSSVSTEPLFDTSQSSSPQDDVVLPLESAQ